MYAVMALVSVMVAVWYGGNYVCGVVWCGVVLMVVWHCSMTMVVCLWSVWF